MTRNLKKTSAPGIYRRGRGYVVVHRDPTGRQHKRAARTMAEARAIQAEVLSAVAQGRYRARPVAVPFDQFAAEWIQRYSGTTARGIRQTTRESYRQDLTRAVRFFGKQSLASIEPGHVRSYAHTLSERGLSRNTVRSALNVVRLALANAEEDGLIYSNPAAKVRAPSDPHPKPADEQRRALSREQLSSFLSELPADWHLFGVFLAQTGVRISEAIALRWGDFEVQNQRVRVVRRTVRGHTAAPKTPQGTRSIPLTDELARALWAYRKRCADPRDSGLMFSSRRGNPVDISNLRSTMFKPAFRRAGVPWATFHTLRHTCASLLVANGYSVKQVQVYLGHANAGYA